MQVSVYKTIYLISPRRKTDITSDFRKERAERLEKLKRVRPGCILDRLSEEDRKEVLSYDGPEVLGSENRYRA